jgi:hypothetical protein
LVSKLICFDQSVELGKNCLSFKQSLSVTDLGYALQLILDLCIPEKELAKTRSQISFIYFQKHS